jgi:phosphoribosylanthranilate isomerase
MVVKVKVCGLTNLDDVRAAVAAGADMLGFIFFPGSPRYVPPETVREIIHALNTPLRADQRRTTTDRVAGSGRSSLVISRSSAVVTVGVFVNESPQTVAHILDFCGLDLAQLHGEEPPAALGDSLRGRVYKALRPRSLDEALDLAGRYALPPSLRGEGRLPALILDAYHPHLRGGTGEAGDWGLAAALAGQYPLLLAGGLSPANVAGAVRTVHPWGVDVSSGIESAPGQKDHVALRAFVVAAKAAEETAIESITRED